MNTAPKNICVRIRNSEKKMVKNHLVYDELFLSSHDQIIKEIIDDAVKEFGDDPEKITVTCKLEIE